MENGLVIKAGWDMTINDMLEIEKNGGWIPRTCHIGNQYPSNLILIMLGAVTPTLYDRTVPKLDIRMNPGYIIKDGKSERIIDRSQDNLLTPFIRYSPSYRNGYPGNNPAHMHFLKLREINPKTITLSKRFQNAREAVNLAIRICLENDICIFNRYVDKSGHIHKYAGRRGDFFLFGHKSKSAIHKSHLPESFWQLNRAIINRVEHGYASTAEGAAFKVEAAYMVDIVEAVLNGKDYAYHSSGPDMVTYMMQKPYQKMMHCFYRALSKSGLKVPDKFEYVIIPTFNWNFMVRNSDRDLVDKLLLSYRNLREVESVKSRLFRDRMNGLDKKSSAKKAIECPKCTRTLAKVNEARESFRIARGEFLAKYEVVSEKRNFFSQYDYDAGSYFPESTLDMTFGEMRDIWRMK
jgi:hypothetical protein